MEQKNEIKEQLSLKDNLGDLAIQSLLIQGECSDYNVTKADNTKVRMNETGGLSYVTDSGEVRHASLSRHSLSQLGTKIGVPSNYLEKCINSGRIDLAQNNVNSWLEDFNKDLFIREYKGRVRGILSSRYSVCDTPTILESLGNVFDTSKFKVKGSYLSEERFHLRMINKEMLPINGEDLFAGLFIDSSDVGRSILTVKYGIYKQVCTNGLIIAKASGVMYQQKHIGISSEEFQEGLVSSLNKIDMITENVVGMINIARKSHTGLLPSEAVEQIRAKTNLSEANANKVINLMNDKYGKSRWGLINSITEVAQDFTLERRLDLERIAGNLLVA